MRLLAVAIDGPVGSGKTTVSQRLAQRLQYRLLDTGAIYRAVALLAQRYGITWDQEDECARLAKHLDVRFKWDGDVNRVFLGDEEITQVIRAPEVSQGASRVSAHSAVRTALLDLQRQLAQSGGVVVEGRDIGTIVLPNAEVKFFLRASLGIRVKRRLQELQAAGHLVDHQKLRDEIVERDHRDETRAHAPLKQATDAIVVDSDQLTIDEVVYKMENIIRERAQQE